MLEQITIRNVRNINKYNILRLLLAQKDLSMNDIALKNNISVMTVKNIVDDLLERNILTEQKVESTLVGRKPRVLNISSGVGPVIVLDLTSRTQMCYHRFSVFGAETRTVPYRCRSDKTYLENLYCFMEGLAVGVAAGGSPAPIGIGASIPGTYFAEEDRISNELIPELNGVRLREMLQRTFGTDNVVIDLDVKLAAFAEMMDLGASTREERNLFYLYLGEGVGGAAVINGEIYSGINGFAGEIGQQLTSCEDDSGRNLESLLSTTVIERDVGLWLKSAGAETPADREALGFDKILELYRKGNSAVCGYLRHRLDILARMVYNLNCLLNPARIIVGGTNQPFCAIVAESLSGRLRELYSRRPVVLPEIYVSKYVDGSAVIGSFESVVDRWIVNV